MLDLGLTVEGELVRGVGQLHGVEVGIAGKRPVADAHRLRRESAVDDEIPHEQKRAEATPGNVLHTLILGSGGGAGGISISSAAASCIRTDTREPASIVGAVKASAVARKARHVLVIMAAQ